MSKNTNELRLNSEITDDTVRLINADGEQVGIVTIEKAMEEAERMNLDLVEIAKDAKPPVCKIMDFGKYRYKQQMVKKQSKKKQHTVKLKEVRFRPRIGEHDLDMKVNHAIKFLEKGNKLKLTVMFRGRELAHKEIGLDLLNNVIERLSEVGNIDKAPLSEGRFINAFLSPK